MPKHAYEILLDSVTGPFQIYPVGPVRWGKINGQPVSPTIVEFWISKSMIAEVRPGVWIKTGEQQPVIEKCPTCGQVIAAA